MRLVNREATSDGAQVTCTISAPGIIVRLKHIDGRKPSDVRRDFHRYCRVNGVIATACEFSEGRFSHRTGQPLPGSEPISSAYQCMGAPAALGALTNHFTVGEWSFALNIAPPRSAQGSGPEKVRPSMGSAFGRPEQVAATRAVLAKDRANRIHAAHTRAK